MTNKAFRDEIIHGAGWFAGWNRRESERVLDCALAAWPAANSPLLRSPAKLRRQLRQSMLERHHAQYGFSPLALLLIGAIVNFLINWFFNDPEHRGELLQTFAARDAR